MLPGPTSENRHQDTLMSCLWGRFSTWRANVCAVLIQLTSCLLTFSKVKAKSQSWTAGHCPLQSALFLYRTMWLRVWPNLREGILMWPTLAKSTAALLLYWISTIHDDKSGANHDWRDETLKSRSDTNQPGIEKIKYRCEGQWIAWGLHPIPLKNSKGGREMKSNELC